MAGTYYQDLLLRFKTHLGTTAPVSSFFVGSSQNIQEMRTTFQTLQSVSKFMDWLEGKAQQEAAGLEQGEAIFCINGGV